VSLSKNSSRISSREVEKHSFFKKFYLSLFLIDYSNLRRPTSKLGEKKKLFSV
jgi:hypothetical protein